MIDSKTQKAKIRDLCQLVSCNVPYHSIQLRSLKGDFLTSTRVQCNAKFLCIEMEKHIFKIFTSVSPLFLSSLEMAVEMVK